MADQKTDPLDQQKLENVDKISLSEVTKPELVPSDTHSTGVMENTVLSHVIKDPQQPEDKEIKISSAVGAELDSVCQQQSKNDENVLLSQVNKPEVVPSDAHPTGVKEKNVLSDVIIDLQPTEGKKQISSKIVEPKSEFQQLDKEKDASEADSVIETSPQQPKRRDNLVTNTVVEPNSDLLYQKQTENVENINPVVNTDPVTNILNPHLVEVKKESDTNDLHPEGDKNFESPSVVQSKDPLIKSSSEDSEAMKNIVSSQVIDTNSDSSSQKPPGDKETKVISENVDSANDSAQCKENGQSEESKESDVAISSIQTTEEDIHNLASHSKSTVSNTKKLKQQAIKSCILSPAQRIKQQKALELLYSLFNLPQKSLQQNRRILKCREKLSKAKDWVQLAQYKYSHQARSYKVLHINNLPKSFTFFHIRGLIMLKTNFNVNSELYIIDIIKDKQTKGCLIRFARGQDCVCVFKDLLGTVLGGHLLRVKVDVDHKIARERMFTHPHLKNKHQAIIELSKAFPDKLWEKKKETNDENIAEKDDEDNFQEKDNEMDDELVEDVALTDAKVQDFHESGEKESDEVTAEEKPTSWTSSQQNVKGQDKNNLTVVSLGNIGHGRGLIALVRNLVTQRTGKYFFLTIKDKEYQVKCKSHEEAVFVSDKMNGVLINGKAIETKLTTDPNLNLTLKRRMDMESRTEDQQAAKKSKTGDDGESADSSATAVNFPQAYIQRQEFNSVGKNPYGLSKDFVEGLGLNSNALGYRVKVMNLHPDVDEAKLREVFSLAGEITQINYNGGSAAEIEYDHPVEAIQAISLFNNHKLFGRKMYIKMSTANIKNKPLPLGLESIGTGLARDGLPLKDVRIHLELRRLQQILHHFGVFRKEFNNDNSAFKFNFLTTTSSRCNLNMPANSSNTSNITAAESSNSSNSTPNTSKENAQDIKTPDDSISIQALGALLVSQGLIPADTDCKDSRNILTALQKKPVANQVTTNPPNSNDNARFAFGPRVPNRPPRPNLGPRGPNFSNRYPNPNNRQPNPNMPPRLQNNQNMTPNFTPNQGDAIRQLMQYISANTTGLNMMQNNMAPNSTVPNMMQNMMQQSMASYFQMAMSNSSSNFNEAMAYPNQFGSNVPSMNQNTGSSGPSSVVAQQPPMMYSNQPQSRWDISSNMIQNATSVQNPVPLAAPPMAFNIPPSTYNQSVPQVVNKNLGSQATVSNPQEPKLNKDILHRQSSGNENDHNEVGSSRGKKSAMLLFKNLPPSVTSEALAIKMREVGEVVFSELTGAGSAVVRFKNTLDAEKCLRLFHRSKVDGQVIEVILVP